MKKVIFIALVTIASVGAFASYKTHLVEETSTDLVLSNLEALTEGEELNCDWQSVSNSHGVPCYHCVTSGNGDSCTCGSVDC